MKTQIKKIIESRPALWQVAWNVLNKNKFLLPHDPTYYALKFLVKRKNSLILDIGANKGVSALSFNKICPESNIVSFEPNLSLERDLDKLKRRIKNYNYNMCGLGDVDGGFRLYIPRHKNVWLHTFASLERVSLEKAIAETYPVNLANSIVIDEFDCRVRTLDSFCYVPDVIKIDAEGFEKKILDGGEATISMYMPSIIFEAVHGDLNDVIAKLRNFGYGIFSFDSSKMRFSEYMDGDNVPYASGSRNLIAIPSHLNVPCN